MSGILVRIGAPFAAGLHAAGRDPGIEARQAAALVNQATAIPALDPAHRFDRIDTALARLESLLADARAASPPDDGLVIRLRGDRVVALRDRERWQDVVGEVAALRQEGRPIPPYVREAEADALLALRHPGEARAAYEEVLAAEPQSRSARVGLFFALLEEERVSEALALADAMAAEGGPKMWRGMSPVPAANWDWLDAQALAANARYYVGEYREAWRRLQPLVDGAPAMSFLRLAKAEIASARGWPRLADEETHIAAVLTSPDRSTEIALAEVALARKRYDEAQQRTSLLVSLFPGDQAVERLRRSVRAHDAPELRLDTQFRNEHDSSADSPGSGYDVRSALLAPPIAERWRLKAAYEFSQANPIEGLVVRTRYGAGVEADWPDASLDATVWINKGTLDRAGGRLAGTWEIGDHLQLAGEGERYSADTPLRATYYGISADDGARPLQLRLGLRHDRLRGRAALVVHRRQRPNRGERLSRGPRRGTAGPQHRAAPGAVVGREHAARCPVFQSPPERVRRRDRGRAAPALAAVRAKPEPGASAHGGRVRPGGQPDPLDWLGHLRAHPAADNGTRRVLRSRLRPSRVRRAPRRGLARVDQSGAPILMRRARTLPLVIAALVLAATSGRGAAPGAPDPREFLAVVLHDVVDERAKLDADGTTTSDLVAFFEYLVSNGWHAITLDDVDRAGRGETTLPEKSILITIDDAYASVYTRVYPLLLATRMPAIVAVPGAWMVRGQAALRARRSSRGRRRARCSRAASSSSPRTGTICTE